MKQIFFALSAVFFTQILNADLVVPDKATIYECAPVFNEKPLWDRATTLWLRNRSAVLKTGPNESFNGLYAGNLSESVREYEDKKFRRTGGLLFVPVSLRKTNKGRIQLSYMGNGMPVLDQYQCRATAFEG
ncbi:MAG TPA: hypothetical protein VFV50_19130 [Bdellovibrionales bacterium]|nr:hypothetical protein [Bdellovibrionales bacterium]